MKNQGIITVIYTRMFSMTNNRKQPLSRNVTAAFCASLVMYFAFNPEFFPFLLHEHVFHKAGSTINHVHTDFSLHVFFKHFSKTSGKPGLKARGNFPVITIAFYNTHHEFVKAFNWSFFFILLLVFIPLIRKRLAAPAVARHARSPPTC